ncbi:class 1a ribonucleoside-diphosphate reductase subunit alpha [Cysteiniphilum sp. QT6929]|uniref:class 1a ribonucleoside-diphosphate reductase subunit alpha n=1 Tax=Cysteiniphilum sp. QT6929 TaxID=2975055 RepID=UPI0024B3AF6E|nr:class 1a ribonucleoside-diphosphate reductase subunit alpha [Cysteiniphilum sp. QT6929]WHN66478.1 ribonucleoside-diphosphate reductase subunit alpha [Cysteiniphilum sp. QT6929]
MNVNVTKRSGRLEPVNLDKIHRVITWAAEGLENVSVSQVELQSHIQLYEGMKTADIQAIIIKTAADLISEETPDYQYMAARLAIFHLRKLAYGEFEPPHLHDHVEALVKAKKYDAHLLDDYSRAEFEQMNTHIDHWRDMNFTYAAVNQMQGKYLVQNRVTGKIYETPQMLYMLVSACLFSKHDKATRMQYVLDFYDAISQFKLSLPTPIMAGVRTPTRQFSSCVLIDTDDSLDSINASASAIVKYVSQRAGIGINAGKIRALGSEIRQGEALHTGCIPFYKYFQTAVKSCSQGGVRGGAATLFYPLWHLEVESLLVLKNNRGVEDNRIRHLDYGVQINRLMYQRLIEQKDITLFSPSDVPGLYDAFFADQSEFERLYIAAENTPDIRKKTLKASELFALLMQERAQTGRIYIQNVDHCNTHSAFNAQLAPIKQSNLCMEITLPTKPLEHIFDENGEIALCTLSAFNLGAIDSLDELASLATLIVTALDHLLDYQNYPLASAEIPAKARRSLGVGVINFAYYLAKNHVKYSDGSANKLTHQTFEAIQYYLLKASNQLAQEKGSCAYFNDTSYAQGLLPIDHYKKSIDEFADFPLQYDWEALRQDIQQHGLRNSTLSAIMPSETSSQISNATNGIEPPRGLVSIKQSKDGVLKQVVPEIQRLKSHYELLWQMPNNTGYLQLCAIIQKFIDQSISANTNYDPLKFNDHKVPMQTLMSDLLIAYKYGLKTLYYHNTRDHAKESKEPTNHTIEIADIDECESGACKI